MISMRALIDGGHYFDRVAAFYRMFSGDVCYYGDAILIEPAKITRVHFHSISDLLMAMRRYGRDGEQHFLIVSHGNPLGLPLRIVADNAATMNSNFMDSLCSILDGNAQQRNDARRFALSYQDDHGRKVFTTERQLDDLLGLIRDVRGLALEHLEFRGCNLGAGPALRSLHNLLRSRLTAAPKVRFVWSRLNTRGVHGTSAWLRNEIPRLPPVRRTFNRIDCFRGAGNPAQDAEIVVALAITGFDAEGRPEGLALRALNSDVLKGFSQGYLQATGAVDFAIGREPPGGGYRPGGFLPMIGFHTPQEQVPFVFPGDGFAYTKQIAYEMAPASFIP